MHSSLLSLHKLVMHNKIREIYSSGFTWTAEYLKSKGTMLDVGYFHCILTASAQKNNRLDLCISPSLMSYTQFSLKNYL